MKRTAIAALIVLALSLSTALASLTIMRRAADTLESMRIDVLRFVEAGDDAGAAERLTRMAEAWAAREGLLEAIAPHETLHAVTQLIVEADANLAMRDRDDFNRAMKLLGLALEHLYLEERLRLENIF